MMAFIKARGLENHLNARDWAAFARAYNGPGHVKNYAKLLADANDRIDKSRRTPSGRVRHVFVPECVALPGQRMIKP